MEAILAKNQPQHEKFYFGLILMDSTVVGLIKGEQKIVAVPTDISMILNFINTNLPRLKQKSPSFELLCLPGLTEEYKVNLFIHLEPDSALKIIFASDESTPELRQEFDILCMAIKRDFEEVEVLDIL